MSDKKLIIKVCGMRDADNMAQVESLGIDMMGASTIPRVHVISMRPDTAMVSSYLTRTTNSTNRST